MRSFPEFLLTRFNADGQTVLRWGQRTGGVIRISAGWAISLVEVHNDFPVSGHFSNQEAPTDISRIAVGCFPEIQSHQVIFIHPGFQPVLFSLQVKGHIALEGRLVINFEYILDADQAQRVIFGVTGFDAIIRVDRILIETGEIFANGAVP